GPRPATAATAAPCAATTTGRSRGPAAGRGRDGGGAADNCRGRTGRSWTGSAAGWGRTASRRDSGGRVRAGAGPRRGPAGGGRMGLESRPPHSGQSGSSHSITRAGAGASLVLVREDTLIRPRPFLGRAATSLSLAGFYPDRAGRVNAARQAVAIPWRRAA